MDTDLLAENISLLIFVAQSRQAVFANSSSLEIRMDSKNRLKGAECE